MQKVDVRIRKDKTTSDYCRDPEYPETKSESEGVAAAPVRRAGISVAGRMGSIALRILNWIEMIFFKKYVVAVGSLSSPAEDLVQLNAALRRYRSPSDSDTPNGDSERPSRTRVG